MKRITRIDKVTDFKYLNLYDFSVKYKSGRDANYYVASRSDKDSLKAVTHDNHADGVIIYAVYGKKRDHIVLVRQYRYAIDGYIYEFPAGLVEPCEDMVQGAKREFKEETGLDIDVIDADPMYTLPRFTTIGMTDESCGTVYGYASGTISKLLQEESEDIEVVIADRAEVRRILKEEKVAIMCAYMLMHFVGCSGDPLEFIKKS